MTLASKILIVDDRPENLVALEGLLRAHDRLILKAGSGQGALAALIEHEVALALVDVQMPDMDGFQLAEMMRGLERTREIPIIFVTAGLHDHARIFRGYESGAVDFLIKPLDPRILEGKVRVFLQLHRQKLQLSERVAELEHAVRERQRAERELSQANARLVEADQRKNEFLGVLSHELRNPLAPLSNSLYILRRSEPGSREAMRAQEVMQRQVTHLATLVNDLLDVTRITRNKIRLQTTRLGLNELIRRAVEDNRPQFEKTGIGLELVLSPSDPFVQGDPTRLTQVIGNLLQNSARFTAPGGLTRVEVSSSQGQAEARITDDGMGMDPDTLRRVFEPFTQAEQPIDRSKGGLGLGLPLARGLVELHGGQLVARSEGTGKGAEFVFTIPLDKSAAPQAGQDARPAQRPGRHRVLIIEDNVDAADSLRDVLQLCDHEVEVAHSGPDGLAKAREFKPEVVLCDIGLPGGMDGYQVAREFGRDESISPAFLVALSGYALPEDRERAARAGFQRHLAKPASVEQLQALLADFHNSRQTSDN